MSVDWSQSRNIVLQRLNAKYARMSDSLRNMPTIVFQDEAMRTITVSPNDAIREVQNLTELGKKIIAATISNMQNLQP